MKVLYAVSKEGVGKAQTQAPILWHNLPVAEQRPREWDGTLDSTLCTGKRDFFQIQSPERSWWWGCRHHHYRQTTHTETSPALINMRFLA